MPNFSMANYTNVADRLKLARDTWVSIDVANPVMLTEATGYITVTVTLKDGRWAKGLAQFRLDLQGKAAQASFPLEDCETSALGRALGKFGFGTDQHFPSREEMEQVEQGYESPAKHDHKELAGVLRELRTELTTLGGKVVPLTSSQVAKMSVAQLNSLIAQTRADLEEEQKRLAAESAQQELSEA